jgi:hypothetical protein
MTYKLLEIPVEISSEYFMSNGNAFALMSKFTEAARSKNINQSVIDNILEEAMSSDYDHLLATLLENIDLI